MTLHRLALHKPKTAAGVADVFLKSSVQRRQFEIRDGGELFSAVLVTGQFRAGTNKGKLGAFVVSYDMGIEMVTTKLWTDVAERERDLASITGTVSLQDLRKKFKRVGS